MGIYKKSQERFETILQLYKEGKIPNDFPKIVYHTYKKEWKGWKDFLS